MQRVGETIRKARETKGVTLEQAAQFTKIRLPYIVAIEQGNYLELPQPTFTRGLIRNYAQFLGLSEEVILAMYRRDHKESTDALAIAPKYQVRSFFNVTPVVIVRGTIISIIVGLLGYFTLQYRILAGPPPLSISSPKNESMVSGGSITVRGITAPESQVSVNGELETVSEQGQFTATIGVPLSDRINAQAVTITVVATSKANKSITKKITVVVKK